MDAVVTAGGIPQPDELLYPYTLGKPKAMLDICGKPMVQWVLDALSDAKRVDRVVLIGLTEESGVTCTKPLVFIPNQPTMIENILVGIKKVLETNPSETQVLIVSSDIPAITSEMVDWEVDPGATLHQERSRALSLVWEVSPLRMALRSRGARPLLIAPAPGRNPSPFSAHLPPLTPPACKSWWRTAHSARLCRCPLTAARP